MAPRLAVDRLVLPLSPEVARGISHDSTQRQVVPKFATNFWTQNCNPTYIGASQTDVLERCMVTLTNTQ